MSSTRKRTKAVSYIYNNSDSDFEEVKQPIKRKRSKPNSPDDYEDKPRADEGPAKAVDHPASLHVIKDPRPLRAALLEWYAGVHESRGMPWRKAFDSSLSLKGRSQRAYEVWISEIMLQQTQVVTVIPYYNKWMEKYPTIEDLANSDIETVNGLWKGLGYYSRAARLLSGAQQIVKDYDGLFPTNAQDMVANVPGIGRYSAGAISSIAYNQCEPVLDGNVNRLLSRVLALHANPKAKSTLDILWDGATAMVKKSDRPGDINQALIELGATVCKVRDPACSSCPLREHCGAYLESQDRLPAEQDIEELCSLCEPVLLSEDTGVTRYPMKAERKKPREETDVVNVVEWRSPQDMRYFLLVRRPEKGLLAGLHEFPSRADVKDVDSSDVLKDIGQSLLRDLLISPPPSHKPSNAKAGSSKVGPKDIRITKIKLAGDVLHIFSHIRKTYCVQWILLEGGSEEEPPMLNSKYVFPELAKGEAKTKTKVKAPKAKTTSNKEHNLRWVKYEDVEHANIGTGVLKVWKKVHDLWEQ